MSTIKRMARHEALLRRMAERNGADLDLALQCGLVSPDDVLSAVRSCTGCLRPGPCSEHLALGRTGVPDACRNARIIEDLAEVMTV